MGSGKGKNRRVRTVGSAPQVVNQLDLQPDENVSTQAFKDEVAPIRPRIEGDGHNVFMAWERDDGKMCPNHMQQSYDEFEETSGLLGVPIPKEDPFYFFSYDVIVAQNLLEDALANGGRTFCIYGPPGTGKNTFIQQAFAAQTKMPVFELDVSSSDELETLIGTDGIDIEVDAHGHGASKTVEKRGKLTRVAAAGGVIVLNEITGLPRDQLTAIHNMIGSGVGDENRYIVIKSPNAPDGQMMIKVHPDTVFFFTYNPERSGRRPHQALLSRSVNFEMAHGDEEAESEILASRLNAVLGNNEQFKALRKKQKKSAKVSVEEVVKTVKFFRELRAAYENDGLEHEPDMRTAVMFEATRQLEAAKERKAGIIFALCQLDFMYDHSLPSKDRMRKLQKHAANFFDEVEDIGNLEAIGFTDQ